MENNNSEITQLDENFLESLFGQEQDTTVKQEDKKEETEVKEVQEIEKPVNDFEFLSEEDLDNLDDKSEEKDTTNTKSEKKETNDTNTNSINLYESQIEFFKKNDLLPEGFSLEDGYEWDEETFGEALQVLVDNVREKLEEDVRGQYQDKLGENVIKFLENGGDYKQFAQLAQEQNKIEELNLSSESGQKAIVKKYYSDVLKWSETRVEKHIDRLFNDGDLEEEATELKSKFDEYYQDRQNELVEQQEKFRKQQELQIQKQKENFQNSLKTKGIKDKELNDLVDFVYTDKYKLPDGTILPELDLKILQIQRQPEELADLVMFLKDKEGYLKKKAIEINNEKVDKTFKAIPKATSKGSANQENKVQKTKFKLVI